MKKILLATLVVGLVSTSASAGWWGSATVETIEYVGSVATIKGKMVGTDAPYSCNLVGADDEAKKALLAIALTAKSSTKTVNLNAVNTPEGCNLWGLRIEL